MSGHESDPNADVGALQKSFKSASLSERSSGDVSETNLHSGSLASYFLIRFIRQSLEKNTTESEPMINAFLTKHDFHSATVADLKDAIEDEDVSDDLFILCKSKHRVYAKLDKKLRETAENIIKIEDALIKKEAYVPNGIFVEGCKYARGVSTHKPQSIKFSKRDKRYSLVSGSSGSGKSMFARYESNSYLYGEGETFVVMIIFSSLIAENQAAKDPSFEMLADNIQSKVIFCIDKTLESYSLKMNDHKLDDTIRLMVVLDEVNDEYGKLFKDGEHLNTLANFALDNIATKYHLVLAGTGLSVVASAVSSQVEGARIIMTPWTMDNFGKMVDVQFGHEQNDVRKAVKEAAEHVDTLSVMIGNPRCSYFLAEALIKNYRQYAACCDSVEQLASIITDTSHDYLNSNGLKRFLLENKFVPRFLVARATLRATYDVLDKYRGDSSEITFPEFDEHLPEKRKHLLKYCYNLVDINVEESGSNRTLLQDDRPPISISPALTIVLSVLLGLRASMSWDWSSFEHIACMGELFRAIRTSALSTDDEKSLTQLSVDVDKMDPRAWSIQKSKQIPGRFKTNKIRMPINLSKYSVILNGNEANGGDTFSFRRIGQMKHTANSSGAAVLPLLEEVNKMGGTYNPLYSKQQTLVHEFEKQVWGRDTSDNAAKPKAAKSKAAKPKAARNDIADSSSSSSKTSLMMFPANNLVLRGNVPRLEHAEIDMPSDWNEEYPSEVTLVFVTNVSSFHIGGKDLQRSKIEALRDLVEDLNLVEEFKKAAAKLKGDEKEQIQDFLSEKVPSIVTSLDITDENLTDDGFLLDGVQIPQYISERLRSNVKLQFILGVSL